MIQPRPHSLTCGTNDRDCNEVKYLQEARDLWESFLRRDTHHDDFELVFSGTFSFSLGPERNVLLLLEARDGNAE